MLAEFSIGRRGAADPATALARIAEAHGGSSSWALAGALGVATGFLILSFYAVIGGWTLDYAVGVAILGVPSSSASAQAQFDHLVASPLRMLVSQTLFMTATALIVARGVAKGIEAVCRILMPLLILMIAALAGFSMMTGESATTLRYLFGFDLDRFTVRGALEALGLGFFSIGVGLSVMITYAAYAGREVNLRQAALMTLVGDTLISFLAGHGDLPDRIPSRSRSGKWARIDVHLSANWICSSAIWAAVGFGILYPLVNRSAGICDIAAGARRGLAAPATIDLQNMGIRYSERCLLGHRISDCVLFQSPEGLAPLKGSPQPPRCECL
jgi:hypothetical protein